MVFWYGSGSVSLCTKSQNGSATPGAPSSGNVGQQRCGSAWTFEMLRLVSMDRALAERQV